MVKRHPKIVVFAFGARKRDLYSDSFIPKPLDIVFKLHQQFKPLHIPQADTHAYNDSTTHRVINKYAFSNLRCDANFPFTCPFPSHPGVGHLELATKYVQNNCLNVNYRKCRQASIKHCV